MVGRSCSRVLSLPILVAFALFSFGQATVVSAGQPASETAFPTDRLRHSDVVLSWGGFSPEVCQKYGVTVWGWGTSYDSKRIAAARSLGLRIVATNTNLCIRGNHKTEVGRDYFHHPRLRESGCLDIAGDQIVVPWCALEPGQIRIQSTVTAFWNVLLIE